MNGEKRKLSSNSDITLMDVYFYEAFEEEDAALRRVIANGITYDCISETVQESGHKNPPARIVSIRTQSIIPPGWSENLDGILSRSTGYDHLIAYRSQIRKPLPLGYLEEYSTRAVAEHAILLTVSLLKRLPQQMRQFSTFDRDRLTGVECAGKNLLVVGVGRIGGEIARIAQSLGFNVKGVDIACNKHEIAYVSKQEGMRWADVIVCAMNLTRENRAYFNYDILEDSKKGCVFVNIARGEHAPLNDLRRLLEEGHLGGVGLDVFEDESSLAVELRKPAAKLSSLAEMTMALLHHRNVILTPHNAFNTQEALHRKATMTAEQIRYFLRNGDFEWKVP